MERGEPFSVAVPVCVLPVGGLYSSLVLLSSPPVHPVAHAHQPLPDSASFCCLRSFSSLCAYTCKERVTPIERPFSCSISEKVDHHLFNSSIVNHIGKSIDWKFTILESGYWQKVDIGRKWMLAESGHWQKVDIGRMGTIGESIDWHSMHSLRTKGIVSNAPHSRPAVCRRWCWRHQV